MKIRLPVFLWVLSLSLFIASVLLLGPTLPARVATHFGSSGHPNGWMSRSSHLLFFTLFGIGFSSFVIGLCYFVRFFPASLLNVPRAEYWRSSEHYSEACDYLFHHSFWFGTLATLWLAAFHALSLIHI